MIQADAGREHIGHRDADAVGEAIEELGPQGKINQIFLADDLARDRPRTSQPVHQPQLETLVVHAENYVINGVFV